MRECGDLVEVLYQRLVEAVHSQPIDDQAKTVLIQGVDLLLCFMGNICLPYSLQCTEVMTDLVEAHRKGPRMKHNRVQKRHEAMDKAIEVGIPSNEELYRFMIREHPDLMYKKQKKPKEGFISLQQMLRKYHHSKKPEKRSA